MTLKSAVQCQRWLSRNEYSFSVDMLVLHFIVHCSGTYHSTTKRTVDQDGISSSISLSGLEQWPLWTCLCGHHTASMAEIVSVLWETQWKLPLYLNRKCCQSTTFQDYSLCYFFFFFLTLFWSGVPDFKQLSFNRWRYAVMLCTSWFFFVDYNIRVFKPARYNDGVNRF